MQTLNQASSQWSSRPDEERFTSLLAMGDYLSALKANSKGVVVSNRKVKFEPASDNPTAGLIVTGTNGRAYSPTHYAFGQLAQLADTPAGYVRKLPAPLAADCMNYGMQCLREVEDVGILMTRTPATDTAPELIQIRAATGPNYGRIWNSDIVDELVNIVGDGVSGDWKVPGEFGQDVPITKKNTTLYANDRNMFTFLADEKNRFELPGRRAERMGTFARGVFVWNSEVGDGKIGVAGFYNDYTCMNRIIWGVEYFSEKTLRHTSGAPDKWREELLPALRSFMASSPDPVTFAEAYKAARADVIADKTKEFLASRFGPRMVPVLQNLHMAEEGRPIETRWDAVTAATAFARGIEYQEERVEMEMIASRMLVAA